MSTKSIAYIGGYTQNLSFVEGKAEGISIFEFDPEFGSMTEIGMTPVGVNPTF